MPMTSRDIQEELYTFPYHHIVEFGVNGKGNFSQFRNRVGGYRYASYLIAAMETIAEEPFESLIDIGCGDGYFLKRVYERFPDKQLAGVDLSRRAVEFAKLLNELDAEGTRHVDFHCADIVREPMNQQFDVATSIAVLEHIPLDEVPGFVAANRDLVKPGGRYIVALPSTRLNVNNIKRHFQHFDPDSARAMLEPYFTVESVEYLNNERGLGRFVRLMLTNPLFILNYAPLRNALFRHYVRHYLRCSGPDGFMLLVKCRRPKA